jgi:anti-sigma factor (TIGR02949 family)
MTSDRCEAMARLISPYLDAELVGEDHAAFLAHIEGCEACRRLVGGEEAVAAALRAVLLTDPAPPELRARIEELLRPRSRWRRPAAIWAAAAAVGLALVVTQIARRSPAPPPIAAALDRSSDLVALAADTHLRYARGQLPLEIDSERPEKVSRWFAGRVPFHLTLPDYPVGPGQQKPYHLSGGRLVTFRGDYAAFVAYRMEARPISLLVTSAALVQPSGGEVVPFGRLVFHEEARDGLKIITWMDNGLTYALASDLGVEGGRSCLVCHAAPSDPAKVQSFPRSPRT